MALALVHPILSTPMLEIWCWSVWRPQRWGAPVAAGPPPLPTSGRAASCDGGASAGVDAADPAGRPVEAARGRGAPGRGLQDAGPRLPRRGGSVEALASGRRDQGAGLRDGRNAWCCLVEAVTRRVRSRPRRSRLPVPRSVKANEADRVRTARRGGLGRRAAPMS